MTKQQIIILCFFFVLMVVLVVTGVVFGPTAIEYFFDEEPEKQVYFDQEMPDNEIEKDSIPGYKLEVPDIVEVPPTEPVASAPTSPDSKTRLSVYAVEVSQSGFSPSRISISHNDSIEIIIYALDNDYDVAIPFLGLYSRIGQGEEKSINFRATVEGTFTFECRDFCPATGGEGEIIVR